MKNIIFKWFGPKYNSTFASLMYWFAVGFWALNVLMVLVHLVVYREVFVFITGVISLAFFILLFRLVYKFNGKLLGWK